MINQASGDAIKAAGTPVTARVHHNTALVPMRDGDFENAHRAARVRPRRLQPPHRRL